MFTQASLKPLAEKLDYFSKLKETGFDGLTPVVLEVEETKVKIELKLYRHKSGRGEPLYFQADFVVFNCVSQLGACGHCVQQAARPMSLPRAVDSVSHAFSYFKGKTTSGTVVGRFWFEPYSPYGGCSDREDTICPLCGRPSSLLNLSMRFSVPRPKESPSALAVVELSDVGYFKALVDSSPVRPFFLENKERLADFVSRKNEEEAREASKNGAYALFRSKVQEAVYNRPDFEDLMNQKAAIQNAIKELWHDEAESVELPPHIRREDLIALVTSEKGRSNKIRNPA